MGLFVHIRYLGWPIRIGVGLLIIAICLLLLPKSRIPKQFTGYVTVLGWQLILLGLIQGHVEFGF